MLPQLSVTHQRPLGQVLVSVLVSMLVVSSPLLPLSPLIVPSCHCPPTLLSLSLCVAIGPLLMSSSTIIGSSLSTHSPPCEQGLATVVVGGGHSVLSLCHHPIIVGLSLSTHGPPCKQGLTTVVVGAGPLHCPGVIVIVVF